MYFSLDTLFVGLEPNWQRAKPQLLPYFSTDRASSTMKVLENDTKVCNVCLSLSKRGTAPDPLKRLSPSTTSCKSNENQVDVWKQIQSNFETTNYFFDVVARIKIFESRGLISWSSPSVRVPAVADFLIQKCNI